MGNCRVTQPREGADYNAKSRIQNTAEDASEGALCWPWRLRRREKERQPRRDRDRETVQGLPTAHPSPHWQIGKQVQKGKKWPRAAQHVGAAGPRPNRGSSRLNRFHGGPCGSFSRPHHALVTGAQLPGSYSRACYRGSNRREMGKAGELGLGPGLKPASCPGFCTAPPHPAPSHHGSSFLGPLASGFPAAEGSKGWACPPFSVPGAPPEPPLDQPPGGAATKQMA